MADLPTIADRLNDTEIAANAPLTETLMRRLGSNINYLLDFLGVTDGSTSPTGDLSDLTNALTIAGANNYDLQQSFVGNAGVVSIGTFSSVKYLDQIFYIKKTDAGSQSWSAFMSNPGSGSRFYAEANIDGTGFFTLNGVNPTNPDLDGLVDASYQPSSPDSNKYKGTMALNISSGTLILQNEIIPFAKIDWRDGASVDLRIFTNTVLAGGNFQVWRGYKLNIASESITF